MEYIANSWGITNNLLKLSDVKEINKSIFNANMMQKWKNRVFKEQIKNLTELANNCGIHIVLLKGVVFAEEYYKTPEMRKVSDIDILVKKTDFSVFVNICKKQGYLLTNGDHIEQSTIDLFSSETIKDQHFDVIQKFITPFTVCIDVHIRLFLQQWFECENTTIVDDFITRSIPLDDENYHGAHKLEIHDLIVYLQIHFIQHLLKHMLEGFIDGEPFFQKQINLLHDIACVINMHAEEINWEHLNDLIYGYNLSNEILFAFNCIFNIYGTIVSLKFIDDLRTHNSKKKCFFSEMCQFMAKKELRYILVNSEYKVLDSFFKERLLISNSYLCNRNKKLSSEINIHYDINNRVQLLEGSKEIASKMKMKIYTWWDDEKLYLKFQVNVGVPFIKKDIIDNTYYDQRQDYFNVYLFNYEPMENDSYVQGFIFKPISIINQGFKLLVQSEHDGNYGEEICNDLDVLWEAEMCGYKATIGIPWEKIKIVPHKNCYFGFNMEMNHFDKETGLYAKLNISGNAVWHDVTGFVKMMLCS